MNGISEVHNGTSKIPNGTSKALVHCTLSVHISKAIFSHKAGGILILYFNNQRGGGNTR